MSVLTGDFIGFSFNGVHSSDLGIIRTSDGSRYNDDLLPTSQDQIVPVPGGDGTYYFGSVHPQKPFSISIAFDSLTEKGIRKLREVFGTQDICKLIFDENPYKYYMVKVTGIPQIKTICFDEKEERIYKGEGTIQFTAYYPYAKNVHKYLNEYNNENKDEWAEASRLLPVQGVFDGADGISGIKVYNAGDLEADFIAYYQFLSNGTIPALYIHVDDYVGLYFSTIQRSKFGNDDYIRVNSKTNLVEGGVLTKAGDFSTFVPSGNLYNAYISDGDFFKIPKMNLGDSMQFKSDGHRCAHLDYDYLYY